MSNSQEQLKYLRDMLQRKRESSSYDSFVNPNDTDYTNDYSDYINAYDLSQLARVKTDLETRNTENPTEEKPETPEDTINWWKRTVDTVGAVGTNVQRGLLNFFDSIGDLFFNVADAIGGGDVEWAQNARDFDWVSYAIATPLNNLSFGNAVLNGDLFNGNYFDTLKNPEASQDYLNTMVNESNWLSENQKINNFATSIEENIGFMLPSIAVGGAAGSQAASLATMGVGSFSTGYNETYKETGDVGKSVAYGGVNAGIEVVSEIVTGKILNGIAKATGLSKVIGEFTPNVNGLKFGSEAFGSAVKKGIGKEILKSMVEEGAEEVFSELLAPWASTIVKGEDALKGENGRFIYTDPAYWKQVGVSFSSGAIIGGFMTGGEAAIVYNKLGPEGYQFFGNIGEIYQNQEAYNKLMLNKNISEETRNKRLEKLGEKNAQEMKELCDNLDKFREEDPVHFNNLMEMLFGGKTTVDYWKTEQGKNSFEHIKTTIQNSNLQNLSSEIDAGANATTGLGFNTHILTEEEIKNVDAFERNYGIKLTEEEKANFNSTDYDVAAFHIGNRTFVNAKYGNKLFGKYIHENYVHGFLDQNLELRKNIAKAVKEANPDQWKEVENHIKKAYGNLNTETGQKTINPELLESETLAFILENYTDARKIINDIAYRPTLFKLKHYLESVFKRVQKGRGDIIKSEKTYIKALTNLVETQLANLAVGNISSQAKGESIYKKDNNALKPQVAYSLEGKTYTLNNIPSSFVGRNDLRFAIEGSNIEGKVKIEKIKVDGKTKLVAEHFLSIDDLIHLTRAFKKGIPMPSIAVHSSNGVGSIEFGGIGFVFSGDTVDTKNDRNTLFMSDAWTPTLRGFKGKGEQEALEYLSKQKDTKKSVLKTDVENVREFVRILEKHEKAFKENGNIFRVAVQKIKTDSNFKSDTKIRENIFNIATDESPTNVLFNEYFSRQIYDGFLFANARYTPFHDFVEYAGFKETDPYDNRYNKLKIDLKDNETLKEIANFICSTYEINDDKIEKAVEKAVYEEAKRYSNIPIEEMDEMLEKKYNLESNYADKEDGKIFSFVASTLTDIMNEGENEDFDFKKPHIMMEGENEDFDFKKRDITKELIKAFRENDGVVVVHTNDGFDIPISKRVVKIIKDKINRMTRDANFATYLYSVYKNVGENPNTSINTSLEDLLGSDADKFISAAKKGNTMLDYLGEDFDAKLYYAESKPERVVDYDEIKSIVLYENYSPAELELIKKFADEHNIQVFANETDYTEEGDDDWDSDKINFKKIKKVIPNAIKIPNSSFPSSNSRKDVYNFIEEKIGEKVQFSKDAKLNEPLEYKSGKKIDSEGNQLSKEQQEYFRDSKVRDENGNLLICYNTSKFAKIKIYDTAFNDNASQGFFFSDSKTVSLSYKMQGSYYDVVDKLAVRTGAIGFDFANGIDAEEVNRFISNTKDKQKVLNGWTKFVSSLVGEPIEIEDIKTYYEREDIPNFVPEEGEDWNVIIWGKYKYTGKPFWAVDGDFYFGDKSTYGLPKSVKELYFSKEKNKELNQVYLNIVNPLIIDANGRQWNAIEFEPLKENDNHLSNTRDIANYAYSNGYDGAIIKNVIDVGGALVKDNKSYYSRDELKNVSKSNVYVAFNSNQIKDINNTKPTSNPDIRFSLNNKANTIRESNYYANAYQANKISYKNTQEIFRNIAHLLESQFNISISTSLFDKVAKELTIDFNTLNNKEDRDKLKLEIKKLSMKLLDANLNKTVVGKDGNEKIVIDNNMTIRTALESIGQNPSWFEDFLGDNLYQALSNKSSDTKIKKVVAEFTEKLNDAMLEIKNRKQITYFTAKAQKTMISLKDKFEKHTFSGTNRNAVEMPLLAYYKTMMANALKLNITTQSKLGISPKFVRQLCEDLRSYKAEALKQAYDWIELEEDADGKSLVEQYRDALIDSIAIKTNPNQELTYEEMEMAYELISTLNKELSNLISDEASNRKKIVRKADLELRATEEAYSGSRNVLDENFLQSELNRTSSPDTVIKNYFGRNSDVYKVLFSDIFDSMSKQLLKQYEFINEYNELKDKYKITDRTLNKKVDVVLGGKTFKMPIKVLLDVYTMTLTEATYKTIINGGYRYNDGKNKYSFALTENDIANLDKYLSDGLKAFANDVLLDIYNGSARNYKAERDNSIKGYQILLFNDFFYPSNKADSNSSSIEQQNYGVINLENTSINKERKKAYHMPLLGMDFESRFTSYINALTKYGEMSDPIKVLNTFINGFTKDSDGRAIRRRSLFKNVTNELGRVFNFLIERIGGKNDYVKSSKMFSNIVQATLYGNPSVVLKQTASLPTVLNEVRAGSFIKAFAKLPYNVFHYGKIKADLMSKSGFLAERWSNMGVIKAEALTEYLNKFSKLFGIGMEKMDEGVIIAFGYGAAVEESKITGEDPVKILERIVANSQSNAINIKMSEARSGAGGYIRKVLSYFTSDLQNKISYLNNLLNERRIAKKTIKSVTDMIERTENELTELKELESSISDEEKDSKDYKDLLDKIAEREDKLKTLNKIKADKETIIKTSNIGKAAKLVISSLMSAMIIAAIGELIKRILGKKDWKWDEEDTKNFAKVLLLEATINNLPYVNTILNSVEYDEKISGLDLTVLNQFVEVLSDLYKASKGEAEWSDAVRDAALIVANLTGIPFNNLYKYIVGIYKNISPNGYKVDAIVKGYSPNYILKEYKDAAKNDFSRKAKGYFELVMASRAESSEGVRDELTSLIKDGYNALPKAYMTSYTNDKDETIGLTEEQINAFKTEYNKANAQVEKLMQLTDYKTKTSEEKAKLIKKIYDTYYSYAKAKVLKTNKADNKLSTLLYYSNGRINISKFVNYLDKISSITKSKNKTRKELVIAYVNRLSLSRNDKLLLLYLAGYKSQETSDKLSRYLRSLGLNSKKVETFLGVE